MSTQTAAYVTEQSGKEEVHYVLADGVTVLPNGVLLLTYDRDAMGNVAEGHIYAPGQWKQVNVQQEDR